MEFIRSIFGKKKKAETLPAVASEMGLEPERRKFQRTSTDIITHLVLPSGKQIKARMLDISEGGVKLELQMALEIGSRIEISLEAEDTKIKTFIMPKWERYEAGDYIYGAEFLMNDSAHRAVVSKFIMAYRKIKGK